MLGVHIAVDITAAAITLIAITAAITAIATMATITIIGATLITAIAIGSRQQTSYQRGARSAAHAAAFLRLPPAAMHLPLREKPDLPRLAAIPNPPV